MLKHFKIEGNSIVQLPEELPEWHVMHLSSGGILSLRFNGEIVQPFLAKVKE